MTNDVPQHASNTDTEGQMAMLPNDYHPGPRCSCRECLSRYPDHIASAGKKVAPLHVESTEGPSATIEPHSTDGPEASTAEGEAPDVLAQVEKALRKNPLIAQFLDVGFWDAHHVDMTIRHNGQDKHFEADWLVDLWYIVRRRGGVR